MHTCDIIMCDHDPPIALLLDICGFHYILGLLSVRNIVSIFSHKKIGPDVVDWTVDVWRSNS